MRPEGNPLDLNNLPEEYGKQAMEESSTTTATSADNTSSNAGFKKKKCGKEGKEEGGSVYECRFCSLKFCKSQALGGHMNRHRQERETETLNRARQLVFSSDGFAGVSAHMGLRDLNFGGGSGQPMSSAGCFPHGGGVGDPSLHFRAVYPMLPTRPPPSHFQPYVYTPPSSSRPLSYPAPYPPSAPPPTSDYYMGRVLAGSSHAQPQNMGGPMDPNYARLGASLNQGIAMEGVRPPMSRDATPGGRSDGSSWNCSYGYGQHNSDPSSAQQF